jgi:hypothetical protein
MVGYLLVKGLSPRPVVLEDAAERPLMATRFAPRCPAFDKRASPVNRR